MPSISLARSLQVDLMTAEVFAALLARHLPAVLLKGPVIARELYDYEGERGYADCDILVREDAQSGAGEVLESLGFQRAGGFPLGRAQHWIRARDGGEVDLHRSFFGVRASETEFWDTMSPHIANIFLINQRIDAFDSVGLCLVVSLHAAEHTDTPYPLDHPGEDLRRGIERWDLDVWRNALSLAERLGAVELFTSSLLTTTEGRALAESLGLNVSADARARAAEEAWRKEAVTARAARMAAVSKLPTAKNRASAFANLVIPSPTELRRLDPRLGDGGMPWLLLAYARRLTTLARNAPPALRLWWRGRRARTSHCHLNAPQNRA